MDGTMTDPEILEAIGEAIKIWTLRTDGKAHKELICPFCAMTRNCHECPVVKAFGFTCSSLSSFMKWEKCQDDGVEPLAMALAAREVLDDVILISKRFGVEK
jgi:hypothetical protein